MTTRPDMTMVEVVARAILAEMGIVLLSDAMLPDDAIWLCYDKKRAFAMARAAIAAIRKPWPCGSEANAVGAMAQAIESQTQRMSSDTSKACHAHMVMMANSTTFRAAYEAFIDAALKEE